MWIGSLDHYLLAVFVCFVIIHGDKSEVFNAASLVVCYYDNKDPFGASRLFYLQRSLLYVITMHVHRRVCHLYIKKAHSYVVISPTMENECCLCSFRLQHQYLLFCFFNCYFTVSYAPARVHITVLIHYLSQPDTVEWRRKWEFYQRGIMGDIHFISWAPFIVFLRGHSC